MGKFNDTVFNFVTLNKRAIVSVFVVISVILAIVFAKYFSLIIFGGIAVCSMYEYAKMISNKYTVNIPFLLIATVVMLLVARFATCNVFLTVTLLLSIISLAAFFAIAKQILLRENTGNSNALENAGAYVLGFSLIVCPWCITITFLNTYELPSVARQLVFAIFLATWLCDTSAYLIGTAIGRQKLAPMTSGKKSIEGLIAGFIGSISIALLYIFLLSICSIRACDPLYILAIGVICGTFGQIGDLAESLLKREVGVKDSGNLLPGHGGVLDRFDSILLNLTIFFLLFAVIYIFKS